jgi:hypothetical protein
MLEKCSCNTHIRKYYTSGKFEDARRGFRIRLAEECGVSRTEEVMAPTLRAILLAAVFAVAGPAIAQPPHAPAASPERTVLPLASHAPPAGRVPRTAAEAQLPPWPTMPQAPRGAPNVIAILLDDVGFGQAGSFGGPIPAPAVDRLAQQGIRYNRFQTSACTGTLRDVRVDLR